MKLKKILLIVILLLIVTGCNKDKDETENENKVEETYVTPLSDFVIKDGTIYEYLGDDYEIVLPDTYNENGKSKEITRIATQAFKNKHFYKITISKNIEVIESEAFLWCYGIATVLFSENSKLKRIESKSFYNSDRLTTIVFPDSVEYVAPDIVNVECESLYENATLYNNGYYLGTTSNKYYMLLKPIHNKLENFTIHESTHVISNVAFNGCVRLKSLTIPGNVETIPSFCFVNCIDLENIVFEEGVKYIGEQVFDNCGKLINITIPNSIETYEFNNFNSRSINYYEHQGVLYLGNELNKYIILVKATKEIGEEYVIPNSTKFIMHEAFNENSKLKKITISENIKTISESLFLSCYNLETVNLPNGLININKSAFKDCSNLKSINIPNSVTTIGDNAFDNCTNLLDINLPNSITSIGNSAFYNCSSLEYIDLPDALTSIGDMIFYGCTNLRGINLPNSITSLGSFAFYQCSSLEHIDLPEGITTIPEACFAMCENLEITISSKIEKIEESALSGCKRFEVSNDNLNFKSVDGTIYSKDGRKLIFFGGTGDSYKVLDGTVFINKYAFAYKTNLKEIEFNKELEIIYDNAFEGCTGLTTIEIPSNVKAIYYNCFKDCTNLTTVILHEGIEQIYDYAFVNTKSLETIIIPQSVKLMGHEVFYCNYVITIYCRQDSQPLNWQEDWYDSSEKNIWGYTE